MTQVFHTNNLLQTARIQFPISDLAMPPTLFWEEKKLCVPRNPHSGVRCCDANWINAASISAPACRATQRWWCEFMRLSRRAIKRGSWRAACISSRRCPAFPQRAIYAAMRVSYCVLRKSRVVSGSLKCFYVIFFSLIIIMKSRSSFYFGSWCDCYGACRRRFYQRRFFV